tara:strand:- start:100 stop:1293 length:1194 start_codon:yes stop_codon:yes gene_type:complete
MRQELQELSKEWPAFFKNKPNRVDEIYKEIKNILGVIVLNSNHKDYIKIKATKGVATVPFAPWIGARDVRLTDKQSEGYSLVYLYSVDLKKVYLSIAFGTGQFLEVFKPKKEAYIKMRKAASRIQKVFENDLNIQDLILDPIDLAATSKEFRQEGYEQSAIFSLGYQIDNLPNDTKLLEDYKKMLDFYVEIFESPLTPSIDNLVNAVADPIKIEDKKPKIKTFEDRSPKKTKAKNKKGKKTKQKKRRSDQSTFIGTKGEKIVFDYEKDKLSQIGLNQLSDKVKWHAELNEKPGYDITSYNEKGEEIFIEVKSSKGKTINDIDLTKNELLAMLNKKNRQKFQIYLVTNALTNPEIEVIKNPSEKLKCIENFNKILNLFEKMQGEFNIDLVTLNLDFRT